MEKSLAKADLLIIDELSYLTFNRHQSELLFQVISERSERGSVIITTNLEFSKWTELFENEMMVSALIDRVTFRSHLLDMNVSESYRFKETILFKPASFETSGVHFFIDIYTSLSGAEANAIIYSIIETAKEHGLNVYKYLTYLFEHLPNVEFLMKPKLLEDFLPWAKNVQ